MPTSITEGGKQNRLQASCLLYDWWVGQSVLCFYLASQQYKIGPQWGHLGTSVRGHSAEETAVKQHPAEGTPIKGQSAEL